MTTQTTLPTTYQQALRWLCRPVSKATYPGDDGPYQAALSALGQPQTAFPSVIVAGSLGKGTVAHLLAATARQRNPRLVSLPQKATWQIEGQHHYRVANGQSTLQGHTSLLGTRNALNIAAVLAEARLTRSIFSGPDYLSKVKSAR